MDVNVTNNPEFEAGLSGRTFVAFASRPKALNLLGIGTMDYYEIKIGRNHVAKVDFDWCSLENLRWYLHRDRHIKYAVTHIETKSKLFVVYMHRLVMMAKPEQIVDHINGDGLDNRKDNLRFCTNMQNFQNSRKQKGCTSKYKGVHYVKKSKKWRAMICPPGKGKSIHIGLFKKEEEAALAYLSKAKELFGEFARLM